MNDNDDDNKRENYQNCAVMYVYAITHISILASIGTTGHHLLMTGNEPSHAVTQR